MMNYSGETRENHSILGGLMAFTKKCFCAIKRIPRKTVKTIKKNVKVITKRTKKDFSKLFPFKEESSATREEEYFAEDETATPFSTQSTNPFSRPQEPKEHKPVKPEESEAKPKDPLCVLLQEVTTFLAASDRMTSDLFAPIVILPLIKSHNIDTTDLIESYYMRGTQNAHKILLSKSTARDIVKGKLQETEKMKEFFKDHAEAAELYTKLQETALDSITVLDEDLQRNRENVLLYANTLAQVKNKIVGIAQIKNITEEIIEAAQDIRELFHTEPVVEVPVVNYNKLVDPLAAVEETVSNSVMDSSLVDGLRAEALKEAETPFDSVAPSKHAEIKSTQPQKIMEIAKPLNEPENIKASSVQITREEMNRRQRINRTKEKQDVPLSRSAERYINKKLKKKAKQSAQEKS